MLLPQVWSLISPFIKPCIRNQTDLTTGRSWNRGFDTKEGGKQTSNARWSFNKLIWEKSNESILLTIKFSIYIKSYTFHLLEHIFMSYVFASIPVGRPRGMETVDSPECTVAMNKTFVITYILLFHWEYTHFIGLNLSLLWVMEQGGK